MLHGLARLLFALALVAPTVSTLTAHEEFRIIGTLTSVGVLDIVVKTKDSKTISIKTNKETLVTRDKKKVQATELKKGGSVVVDALGDDYSDLLALEIRLVPDIAPSKGK